MLLAKVTTANIITTTPAMGFSNLNVQPLVFKPSQEEVSFGLDILKNYRRVFIFLLFSLALSSFH